MSLLVALFVQIARIDDAARFASDQVADRSMSRTGEASRSRMAAQIERFRSMRDARFRQRVAVEGYASDLGIMAGQLTRLA
jgi:hypothetical protein